jgi:2-dehydro-3-deoxygluconokinase
LPRHAISESLTSSLRGLGVDVNHILWRSEGRLGLYFVEVGANQRGSTVIYDREYSAVSMAGPDEYDFDTALDGVTWLHVTGITPSISEAACRSNLELVRRAKSAGATVSCDLNYRKKLWRWGKQPGEVMPELVGYCDVAVGNEEDADKVFGIRAPKTDVTAGEIDADNYRHVCDQLARRFPNLRTIAITLRGSVSASHNTWSGVLWGEGRFYKGPQFDATHIVDRVGGGDSFVAGLIYALLAHPDNPQRALDFAVAASCLKHSISGDFNLITVGEVEKLMGGDVSGRVSR